MIIEPATAPVLGLRPEAIFNTAQNANVRNRAQEIAEAIKRRADTGATVPVEWADELLRRIGEIAA